MTQAAVRIFHAPTHGTGVCPRCNEIIAFGDGWVTADLAQVNCTRRPMQMSARTMRVWLGTMLVGAFVGGFIKSLGQHGYWTAAILATVVLAVSVFALGWQCERRDWLRRAQR